MKNIASILTLMFLFTFTVQAQKKRGYKQQLTINQQTSLKVKQMTLVLDLSDKQQQRVTPLLRTAIAFRHSAMEKRKEAREQKKRPTSDEVYAIKMQLLDNKISLKRSMQEILNTTQFETFKKVYKQRMKKKKAKEQRQRSTKK
jgi:hypothetical protein